MEELWYKIKLYLVKFAYLQKRNRFKRYGFAAVMTALTIPLFIFVPDVYFQLIDSQVISFLTFFLVVTASAWYGGLGPGILSSIFIGVINYFTILKEDYPFHPAAGDLLVTSIYITVGFLISLISEARYEAEFQKDQFIALAAHEIKNPLTTIKGYANLLQKRCKKEINSKLSEYLEEVVVQAEMLLELTNDLLDVTKIEIGKFVYKDELFDFDSLVRKVVKNIQVINKKRTITLSGSAHKIISGDRYRLGQVVTNLLTNAIKYSPEKNPVKVKIKSKLTGVSLAVRDYGIGIPKSEQKAIFKNFYQLKDMKHGGIHGLGLGLYISAQIVKQHKGKLEVKSSEGKGSVFYLEIPKNY